MQVRKRDLLLQSFPDIALPLVLFTLESVLAAYVARTTDLFDHLHIPDVTLTLIGTAISVLLASRINAAYARWWEARILWGSIVNETRSLLREAIAFELKEEDRPGNPTAQIIGRHLIAYVHALNLQLGGGDVQAKIMQILDKSHADRYAGRPNPAVSILTDIAHFASDGLERGIFRQYAIERIDWTLSNITNAQGGMERIRNTSLPRAFALFPLIFVFGYAAFLPLALADELRGFMPVVTFVIIFAFLIVNSIGRHLEHPFANTSYNVGSNQVAAGIETVLQSEIDSHVAEALAEHAALKRDAIGV